jgi:hypothetical protein
MRDPSRAWPHRRAHEFGLELGELRLRAARRSPARRRAATAPKRAASSARTRPAPSSACGTAHRTRGLASVARCSAASRRGSWLKKDMAGLSAARSDGPLKQLITARPVKTATAHLSDCSPRGCAVATETAAWSPPCGRRSPRTRGGSDATISYGHGTGSGRWSRRGTSRVRSTPMPRLLLSFAVVVDAGCVCERRRRQLAVRELAAVQGLPVRQPAQSADAAERERLGELVALPVRKQGRHGAGRSRSRCSR